jgi:hypothetical protein
LKSPTSGLNKIYERVYLIYGYVHFSPFKSSLNEKRALIYIFENVNGKLKEILAQKLKKTMLRQQNFVLKSALETYNNEIRFQNEINGNRRGGANWDFESAIRLQCMRFPEKF